MEWQQRRDRARARFQTNSISPTPLFQIPQHSSFNQRTLWIKKKKGKGKTILNLLLFWARKKKIVLCILLLWSPIYWIYLLLNLCIISVCFLKINEGKFYSILWSLTVLLYSLLLQIIFLNYPSWFNNLLVCSSLISAALISYTEIEFSKAQFILRANAERLYIYSVRLLLFFIILNVFILIFKTWVFLGSL